METIALPVVKSLDRKDIVAAILEMCETLRVTLKTQRAYLLATAEHESANFKALKEWTDGTSDYFTRMYEGRSDLGNTEQGDGENYPGRGLVHITGRRNYTLFTSIFKRYGLDIDLVNNPELAERPDIAVFTLVYGCMYGVFTGASINDYINESETDFYNARRVVNGLDRAEDIAAIASDWLNFI